MCKFPNLDLASREVKGGTNAVEAQKVSLVVKND